jgi:hypothetical protein
VALELVGDLHPEPFRDLNVTLISAAENQLWHRDAVDLMYDWLRNHQASSWPVRCRKRVFGGYRIQELLWGVHAREEVYTAYLDGVRGSL